MSAMTELTKAIIQPDCKSQMSVKSATRKSRFRRVSYNADSQRGQRERIAKDVSHAELFAPAAISAVVVIHLLVEIWAKACVTGHQVLCRV